MTDRLAEAADPGWLTRTLNRLDADAIAATAAELIAIPSVSGRPAENACLDHVAAWLESRGLAVERWTTQAGHLPAPAGWSAEIDRPEVLALAAAAGATGGPGLLVNAHLDVVPAADQPGWSHDPFTASVVDGWLIGRGAADTKGGLAAAMHVLVALDAETRACLAAGSDGPSGRLVLTPVVGEEDGGAGTLAALAGPRGLPVAAAVVVEPTALQVAHAGAGAFRFRVSVTGRTAHGSVRHQGVSAIEKAWLVHQALLDLERSRDARWPLCVGRIEGGSQPCDVPDLVVLDGRYGIAPHEDPDLARSQLEAAVSEVAAADDWLREHPPIVEWVGAQWLPAQTPVDDPVVEAFSAVFGGQAPVTMPYGSDAGLLQHLAGLPTVIVGPGEVADAHAADERVAVADLGRFAELLLRGAVRWWSAAGAGRRPRPPRS